MPKEHEKIKYLPWEKSLKVLFIIYADLECLLKKLQSCQNNPESSYTEKKVKHKPSGYVWWYKKHAIFIEQKIVSKSFVKI